MEVYSHMFGRLILQYVKLDYDRNIFLGHKLSVIIDYQSREGNDYRLSAKDLIFVHHQPHATVQVSGFLLYHVYFFHLI